MDARIEIEVRPAIGARRDAVLGALVDAWGDTVARRGELVALDACELTGAWRGDALVGAMGQLRGPGPTDLEVVALNAFVEHAGVGRALMDQARASAASTGCTRLWLITTNDNARAIAFYERWGMRRCRRDPGAVTRARARLKASIPLRGLDGAPITDEYEYELRLEGPGR